jgi:glutamyl-tRNA synthetase
MTDVRVRFAPSPTGPLHIGGVRTALFNYLFAKKHHGTFILRIEDTDQTRYVANSEKYITDALEWCGISFDEGPNKNELFGPYRQSERKHLYKQYADELIEKGLAYVAFDSPEELNVHRKNHEEKGKTFIYNWHNREKLTNSISLSQEDIKKRIANGDPYVVRFKMFDPTNPNDSPIINTVDLIRGEISFKKEYLDDKILFKSDGMPTYHLANVVDDHLMKISHIIRGEEWLPSVPLHIALYKAFGWTAPEFAHLPLILKPVGKGKLSKRDGDQLGFPVFPLEYTSPDSQAISSGYKEEGYFADAFINMLALLGWNPGTEQEIFSLDELCEAFTLDRVHKSGAQFNPDKTKWFNQQYIQKKSNSELASLFSSILREKKISVETNYVEKVVSLIKERATFVSEFWSLSDFFFVSPTQYDPKAAKKNWKEGTSELMEELMNIIALIDEFTSEQLEDSIKKWILSKEIGFGKIMQPLRLSLVGAMKGPHLFDIIEMIGKTETLRRIKNAIENIQKN